MRVVALVSGGKDSTFNMLCCQHEGHQVSNEIESADYKPTTMLLIKKCMTQTDCRFSKFTSS